MTYNVMFIDSGMLLAAHKGYGLPDKKFDWRKVIKKYMNGFPNKNNVCYYYGVKFDGTSEEIDSADRFYHALKTFGINVRLGGFDSKMDKQKGVDIELAIDWMIEVLDYSVGHSDVNFYIYTADSDFVPLFKFARKKGIKVNLLYFNILEGTGSKSVTTNRFIIESASSATKLGKDFLEEIGMDNRAVKIK